MQSSAGGATATAEKGHFRVTVPRQQNTKIRGQNIKIPRYQGGLLEYQNTASKYCFLSSSAGPGKMCGQREYLHPEMEPDTIREGWQHLCIVHQCILYIAYLHTLHCKSLHTWLHTLLCISSVDPEAQVWFASTLPGELFCSEHSATNLRLCHQFKIVWPIQDCVTNLKLCHQSGAVLRGRRNYIYVHSSAICALFTF